MEDNISVAVTEIFPASCEMPARAVLENLWNLPEPMAKTSPDSRFGILRKHSQPLHETLEQVEPLPRTGTFQDSPYTESEPPGTCPKLSCPKALNSLRHHLPSPCDILVLGGKH